jgi:hypothetical protein
MLFDTAKGLAPMLSQFGVRKWGAYAAYRGSHRPGPGYIYSGRSIADGGVWLIL